MLCGEQTLVNQGCDEARAVTLKCRAWTCPDCAEERSKQLTAAALAGSPNTFLTLTVNPRRGASAPHRARMLAHAWRTLVKRIKRHYGYQTLPYLCVFEATKSGEPHLHVLCRVKWIDQRWLSRQMKDLIDAPIVDIRRVQSTGKVAAYVSKYLGKAPHRFEGTKRYWSTRDYQVIPWEKPEQLPGFSKVWELRDTTIDRLEQSWREAGFEVTRTRCTLHASWVPIRAPPGRRGIEW